MNSCLASDRLAAGDCWLKVLPTLGHLPHPAPLIDTEALRAEASDLLLNQLVNRCCFQPSALEKPVSA